MVFSSHLFVFYFLPLVLLLNYTLPFPWLSFTLMCANFLFYGWANPAWLGPLRSLRRRYLGNANGLSDMVRR